MEMINERTNELVIQGFYTIIFCIGYAIFIFQSYIWIKIIGLVLAAMICLFMMFDLLCRFDINKN